LFPYPIAAEEEQYGLIRQKIVQPGQMASETQATEVFLKAAKAVPSERRRWVRGS